MRLENVWLRYGRRWPVGAARRRRPGSTRARWRSCWAATGPASRPCSSSPPGCCGRSGAGWSTGPARVGWVPERFPADQPFTVTRYLTAMGRVAGLGRAAADRGRRPPGPTGWACSAFRGSACPTCPRAPRRRSAWPRRCCAPPGLLVLDEPWEGLDAAAREPGPRVDRRGAGRRGSGPGQRPPRRDGPAARRPALDGGRRTGHRGGATGDPAVAVVEVAVPAARVAGTVARLRADGHHVLRVREPTVRPHGGCAAPSPCRPRGGCAAHPCRPRLASRRVIRRAVVAAGEVAR